MRTGTGLSGFGIDPRRGAKNKEKAVYLWILLPYYGSTLIDFSMFFGFSNARQPDRYQILIFKGEGVVMGVRQGIQGRSIFPVFFGFILLISLICFGQEAALGAALNAGPPPQPIKLIFIHHSCGENWLADGHGGLARALQKNNYFVSDTNYGWGPDAIGDRTDIENWPEWFTGPKSGRYMRALFIESGVQSPYRRTLADPGGENRIVMFKSCFPNSDISGRGTDKPRRGHGLTVSNAKAIYLEMLTYFATRPDKLFFAVTAPPLTKSRHSRNARAFNNWLVHQWLKNYPGSNVAVFDFYNVLTGRGNRHSILGGGIRHTADRGKDTLAYPGGPGDDHPSSAGNRKATQDFVPLLNAYVNQWLKTAPATPPGDVKVQGAATEPPDQPAPAPAEPAPGQDLIDNFESDAVFWEAFLDGQNGTSLSGTRDTSRAKRGKRSLRIDFQVADKGWATYSMIYESPHNWKKKKGLSCHLHTDQAGIAVILTVHNGKQDGLTHFEHKVMSTRAAVKGWQKVEIPWENFVQPDWEGDGTAKFDPARAMGLAFVFSSYEPGHAKGRIWVDEVKFISGK